MGGCFHSHERVNIKSTYDASFEAVSFELLYFEYILETGANWSGPIEDAYIEVEYANTDDMRWHLFGLKPKGYEVKGNRVVWQFKDFIPEENIYFSDVNDRRTDWFFQNFMEGWRMEHPYDGDSRLYTENDLDVFQYKDSKYFSWLLSGQGMLLSEKEFIEGVGHDRTLAFYLRNEIFARKGRQFKTSRANYFFGHYKSKPDFTPDRLNDIEKRNVQFIVEYEKKKGWK